MVLCAGIETILNLAVSNSESDSDCLSYNVNTWTCAAFHKFYNVLKLFSAAQVHLKTHIQQIQTEAKTLHIEPNPNRTCILFVAGKNSNQTEPWCLPNQNRTEPKQWEFFPISN